MAIVNLNGIKNRANANALKANLEYQQAAQRWNDAINNLVS